MQLSRQKVLLNPLLLTIGIPTYNRAYSLKNTLPRLSQDLVGLESKIQILILDNASSDETEDFVTNWIHSVKNRIKVRYIRNKENIGMSKNIISCFFQSDTSYTTFMGDDDCLNRKSLIKLIEILEGPQFVSAVIGTRRSLNYDSGEKGYIGYKEAALWFYIYGNGAEGVVHTKTAISSIEKRNLRNEIEKIVWPQTVMGFLAMFDKKPAKIYAADFSLTDSFSDYQSITNKTYWVHCFDSFLKAAILVDNATKKKTVKRALLNYKNSSFYSHIRIILWYSLIDDIEVDTLEIQIILRKYFGIRGFFCSFILWLSDHKKGLIIFSRILYIISKRKTPSSFDIRLKEIRQNHKQEVYNSKESKKRFGDWF
jgi:glycosyltransferase involved in cell wall biosynthesis